MRPKELMGLVCVMGIAAMWAPGAGASDVTSKPASSPARSRADELRSELLGGDLSDPYGLLDEKSKDSRLRIIRQLTELGTPGAVHALCTFLTTDKAGRNLKQRALVALGRIGSREAVDAIRQFETRAERRRREPSAFTFGPIDYGIDHCARHELKPLATVKDAQGASWTVFRWPIFGWTERDLWITQSVRQNTWSSPTLLELAGLPRLKWNAKLGLEITGDQFKLIVDGQPYESTIEQLRHDSDNDRLPDTVERILTTDPMNPDTDGDGIKDGEDGNPLTPKLKKALDDEAEIRQALFTALFATCNSMDTLVIVAKDEQARQEYHGYRGFVIASPERRNGFVNITSMKINNHRTQRLGHGDDFRLCGG